VNGWLLYRRDCDSFGVSNSKQKDLLSFEISVAEALIKKGKDIISKKRGRPSLELMSDGSAARSRSASLPPPASDQSYLPVCDHKTTYGEIRLVTGRRWERPGKDAKTYHAVGKPLFFAVNAMCICVWTKIVSNSITSNFTSLVILMYFQMLWKFAMNVASGFGKCNACLKMYETFGVQGFWQLQNVF